MKKVVSTDRAPGAIGPYSQAVIANGMVYASGQIPVDPATGGVVTGGIAEQTRRVLENVKALLEAAGSGLDKVVKTTVFLTDMNDFAEMNGIYAEYFKADMPARSTLQVSRLPKDVSVEIETIAIVGG